MISEAVQFHLTISAWFGQGGKPVPQDQAQARANVCLACPLNKPRLIWEGLAGAAALLVHRQIELKAKMALVALGESNLHVCEACRCILKLKVWQPLKFIEFNMTDEQIQRLHPNCWILDEISKKEQCDKPDC